VVGELVFEFQMVEGRHLNLKRLATRICDLLLRSPPGRFWLADHLDGTTKQFRVELVTQWKAEVELEALRSLVTRVWDLVLDDAYGLSSLAASMSAVAEQLESLIDAVTANGVS
jgi:hypothetical protein